MIPSTMRSRPPAALVSYQTYSSANVAGRRMPYQRLGGTRRRASGRPVTIESKPITTNSGSADTLPITRQESMNERDGHRAFTSRRGQASYRPLSHISRDEHSRHARFEQVGLATLRPVGSAITHEIDTGQHEALRVPCHRALEPMGARRRPDEYEQPVGG